MVQLVVRSLSNANEDYGQFDYSEQLFLLRCKNNALHMVYNTDYAMRNRSFSHTKDRGEVEGTTKKMYRQKGTGGARHGTARASQFRGGGVTFGPKFALRTIKINRNLKLLAVLTMLNKHIERGSLIVLNNVFCQSHKTKDLNNMLSKFISNLFDGNDVKRVDLQSFLKKNRVLFVDKFDSSSESKNFLLASRNIVGVKSLDFDYLNIFDVFHHKVICITVDALNNLLERFQNRLLKIS